MVTPAALQLAARAAYRPAHWGRPAGRGRAPLAVQAVGQQQDQQQQEGGGEWPSSAADVIKRDVAFLEARTGLDLHTPLGAVVSAHDEIVALHDEVVAILNPIAGRQMKGDLEEQIAGLQQQLAVAHQQVRRAARAGRAQRLARRTALPPAFVAL